MYYIGRLTWYKMKYVLKYEPCDITKGIGYILYVWPDIKRYETSDVLTGIGCITYLSDVISDVICIIYVTSDITTDVKSVIKTSAVITDILQYNKRKCMWDTQHDNRHAAIKRIYTVRDFRHDNTRSKINCKRMSQFRNSNMKRIMSSNSLGYYNKNCISHTEELHNNLDELEYFIYNNNKKQLNYLLISKGL